MTSARCVDRRFRSAIAVVLGLLLTSTALAAQRVVRCTPTADSVARPCELDAWPLTTAGRQAPRYPDILRVAGVEGEVFAQYEVDTSGRALIQTLHIARSTHYLFANAVRNALPVLHFEPPRRQGVPVRVRVDELVSFRHGGGEVWRLSGGTPPEFGVDSTGTLRTTIAAWIAYDSVQAPRLTSEDRLEVYSQTVDWLMRFDTDTTSRVTFCVEANGSDLPGTFFERWTARDRPVVPKDRCPRTYQTMIAPRDSTEIAPPGWIDPIIIGLSAVRPWARDVVILEATAWQGTGGRGLICQVSRRPEGWRDAYCAVRVRMLS